MTKISAKLTYSMTPAAKDSPAASTRSRARGWAARWRLSRGICEGRRLRGEDEERRDRPGGTSRRRGAAAPRQVARPAATTRAMATPGEPPPWPAPQAVALVALSILTPPACPEQSWEKR